MGYLNTLARYRCVHFKAIYHYDTHMLLCLVVAKLFVDTGNTEGLH